MTDAATPVHHDKHDSIAECAAEALHMATKSGAPVYVVVSDEPASNDTRGRITYRDSPPEDAPCVVATPDDEPRVIADRTARLLAD